MVVSQSEKWGSDREIAAPCHVQTKLHTISRSTRQQQRRPCRRQRAEAHSPPPLQRPPPAAAYCQSQTFPCFFVVLKCRNETHRRARRGSIRFGCSVSHQKASAMGIATLPVSARPAGSVCSVYIWILRTSRRTERRPIHFVAPVPPSRHRHWQCLSFSLSVRTLKTHGSTASLGRGRSGARNL